jgi:hypothetical protein
VSDIFNEVDEEIRRERLRQIWARYGNLIIAAALVIIIGVGGWRGKQYWDAQKAAEAGAVFEGAVALAAEGKHEEAEAAFGRIADAGTAYRVLARLRQAGELAVRDPQAAAKLLDALAADSGIGVAMQDLARVRSGWLLVDTASFPDMRDRLEPVTQNNRAFRHSARELLAVAAYKTGDKTLIKQWADAIIGDPEAPAGARTRAEMLLTLAGPDARS